MKRALLIIAALFATTGRAAVPAPLPLVVNSYSDNAPLLQLYRGSPRTVRVQFKDGATASDLTGLTTNDLHLTWSVTATSSTYIASDVAIVDATNGTADFTFTSQDINYAPGLYYYEASAGSTIVRQGRLQLGGGVYSTGTNSPAWQTNVNLSGYTFINYPWLTDAASDGTTYGRKDGGWVAVSAGGGSTTDTTARALAQAASNLAALANANQTAASNSLAARLLLVSNAIPSTAGFATNNAWRADTERVGLVASNALAGLPSLAGLSNGVTAAAQAATNAHLLALSASNMAAAALAGLPSLAGLSNGVTSAALAATNADAKAAQAQVLGTNAAALAALAITNLQESGSGNAFTGLLVSGKSGTLQRGTVAGGSGSETQGLASVLSLGNSVATADVQSAYVVIGGNARFYRHPVYDNGDVSVLILGGGGTDSEGSGRTNNVVSNALDSVILGGNGNRISGPPPGGAGVSAYQQIFGSHASDIGWTDTNLVTKYNSIGGGNNHHVWDSSFATVFGGGGTFIYNCDSVGSLSASHHFFTNCEQVIGMGGVIAMSNRAGVVAYASDWHNDTNALVPNRDNSAHLGVEWIQQTTASGTYDLFSNGWMIASIISTNNQYSNTNAIPRDFNWLGGQRNRFLSSLFQPGGTNIFGLVGGGGYSNAWLMTTAQGATLWGGMSNSSLSDISGAASVGGFNNFLNGAIGSLMGGGRANSMQGNYSAMLGGQGNTLSGFYSVLGGRENVGAANYTTTFGLQNQVQSGAQVSTIAGGSTNVIAGAMYAFIGAGTRNIIGSGGTYSFIGAGTTNQALGQGQFVGGNSAGGGANATNSFVWNAAQSGYTNSTPRSAAFNVPGGFTVRGAEYGGNAGRGVLTGGVCVINLPFAMSDAAYSIHLTYATDAALLTPLSATGTTSAIYILGSGNNPFHWQVKGVTP